MEATPSNRSFSDLVAVLDVGGRSVALMGGLAYLLGLIVTNVHLQEFGGTFLGFFTLQYLSAGLWALYPLMIGATIYWLFFTESVTWSTHRIRRWRRAGNLARVTVGLVFILSVAFIPLMLLDILETAKDLAIWLLPVPMAFWIVYPHHYRHKTASLEESTRGPPKDRHMIFGFYGLAVVFVIVWYCVTFSYPYRTIPARWGGGQPALGQMVLTENMDRTLLMGFGFAVDSKIIEVRVLALTNDVILVMAPASERGVLVRREDVVLLTLEPKND